MKKIFCILLLMGMMYPSEAVLAQTRKIGVCDWMILKRHKPGAFSTAKQMCADGIEFDMGGLGKRDSFDNKLRNDAQAAAYIKMIDSVKVEVGAVAMSGLYGQSFIEKKSYKWLIEDCLNTMDKLGNVKVAFLPLGGCGNDWTTNKKKYSEVVKRLREVGKMAAARGKVIGIDTPMDAAGNLKLLKAIKSDGVKIFYKWQTAIENNLDICADMKALGKDNICAIHASNTDGVWIEKDNAINAKAIRATLDEMGWEGWLFVERSRDTTMVKNTKANYGANVAYLKDVFAPVRYKMMDTADKDTAYVNTIKGRAKKVTDALNITGTAKGEEVQNLISNHYFTLNKIYEDNVDVKAKLYDYHGDFIANLENVCTPQEIEQIKDILTYDVMHVKYNAQVEMIPTMNIEEREQLMSWLREAREYAIDAKGSKEKHAIFKKYMGRFNMWMSKRGYNMKQEEKNWVARNKEKEARRAKFMEGKAKK